jgi:hypothetical protein
MYSSIASLAYSVRQKLSRSSEVFVSRETLP